MKTKILKICIIVNILSIVILMTCNFITQSSRQTMSEKENTTEEWIITQYGRNDINLSFYTIYNAEKGLIVIDGGWTEDAAGVREVINELGGYVDAWILTHPHQDHIGAFNLLYTELEGITVEQIYTVDMASPEECIETAPWDSVDAYNQFLDLDIDKLTYLYAGDTLQICGLEFEILSTYDENVNNLSKDFLNDGSMMFKVTNESESMLFCADVGINMSNFLIDQYGDTLKADYLQMAHHGYGGLSDEFYRAVSPQIAFFDAPDWLMYDETGKYDNPENVAFMESLEAEIYSFNSVPNSIILN